MAESSQQPVNETTQALRSSALNQRLDRRRTEPLGILDIRPFDSQFARVPGWMVQRSAFLDQLQKRYSSQDNASADGTDLVIAASLQSIPRERTLTLPTPEQTAAPSSFNIAKPVAPTTTSDSPLSGQFRVSRKAIPLAKVDAIASSQTGSSKLFSKRNPTDPNSTEVVSSSNEPSNQRSVSENSRYSQSIETSIQTTNQPSVATEIVSAQNISQPVDKSLILPKRLNQDVSQGSDSSEVNLSPSFQTGIEQSSVSKNYPQQNVAIPSENATQNQPPVVDEITQNLPPLQQAQSDLILPKPINPENIPSSDSGEVNLSISSQTGIEQSSINKNSPQQNVTITLENSTQNPPPIVDEIIHSLHPLESAQSDLILPKRINPENLPSSESGEVNLSTSSQTGIEQSSINKNAPQQNVAISSENATQNQPPIVGEITQSLQPLQSAQSDLILPKRMNLENLPSSDSGDVNLSTSSQTEIEQSSINKNAPQQNVAISSENATRNQPPIVDEITQSLPSLQQAQSDLILPKRINPENLPSSESGEVNLSTSSQTGIEQSSVNKNAPQQNVTISSENATRNQPPVVGEITQSLQSLQSAQSDLILPKRINPENLPSSESGEVNLSNSSQIGIKQSSINKKSPQQNAAILSENPTQNPPPVVDEITQSLQSLQQAEPNLILPKRLNQDIFQGSNSSEFNLSPSFKSEIEKSSIRKSNPQHNVATPSKNATENPPYVVGEITQSLPSLQQAQSDLILPKRLNQDILQSSNSSEFNLSPSSQSETEKSSVRKSNPQQNVAILSENPTENQPHVVGEITQSLQSLQQFEPNLILPKRLNQEALQGSDNSSDRWKYSNLPSGKARIKRPSFKKNSTLNNFANAPLNKTQHQPVTVEKVIQDSRAKHAEELLILPKRISHGTAELSTSNVSDEQPTRITQTAQPVFKELAEMPLVMRDTSGKVDNSFKEFKVASGRSHSTATTPLAIASEIPVTANSTGHQNMIWRKNTSEPSSGHSLPHVTSSNNQNSLPLAISPAIVQKQIARESLTTSHPTSFKSAGQIANPMSGNNGAIPAQTTTQVQAVNVAEIAEQVSRILYRQLTVERERRGMNLWY
ncbi:hypothetical protein [Floridanema aerugineum]|uniref:Uncharacterized protein n=1 Tax=Floridaenema aerugineum BLCC-F46 TaxID=3153654 RepID=A0ABV4WXZ8_9CYAN